MKFLRLTLVLCCLTTAASAQTLNPYGRAVYSEGPGFRLGASPLTLHPGIATELGFDSNVFYTHANPAFSGLLRLKAHIDMATMPPQLTDGDSGSADPKVDFRFSTQLDYREYLSSDPVVRAQRSVNVYSIADVKIWPKRRLTLGLFNRFERTVDPRNTESTGNFASDNNITNVSLRLKFNLLELVVSDTFRFSFWESHDLKFGDNYGDEASAVLTWRFLPNTVGIVSTQVGFVTYQNNPLINSVPLHASVGLASVFTRWFNASAMGGYGAQFTSMQKLQTAIARVNLNFLLPRENAVGLGYRREFSDTLFANSSQDDEVNLRYSLSLGLRFRASLEGKVTFRQYNGLVPASTIYPVVPGNPQAAYSTNDRHDILYAAALDSRYVIRDWCSLALNYTMVIDSSNFALLVDPNDPLSQIPVSYMKHTAFFRVDFAY